MKFGDVVTAAASLFVFVLLLDSVVSAVFVRVISREATDIAGILSFLVVSLIVGYVFAPKIQEESRIGAIGSIAVLSTVVFVFFFMALAANPLASPAIKENLESTFSTTGWKPNDWLVATIMVVALGAVSALISSSIGLYAGSMLRKPKKS